jgi:hypothetical protein
LSSNPIGIALSKSTAHRPRSLAAGFAVLLQEWRWVMIRRKNSMRISLVLLFSLPVLLAVGCIGKKELTKGPGVPLDLRYKQAGMSVLKYRMNSNFVQTVTVRGKPIEITAEETRDFSVNHKSTDEGNLSLVITIDSMEVNIATPQGNLEADASQVIGKTFEMAVSPLGEELDISGADTIKYDLGTQGRRSIESQFSVFFPDLPGKPVGIEDSWTTESTATEEQMNNDITITIKNENTIVGFEMIQGLECAKISAPFTGTLKGKGEEEGVELITDGKIKGTSTWYFAYAEGVYVKETTVGTAEGTITAMAPERIEIPLKRDFEIEVRLLE